jgi:hypothetical protein
MAFGSPLAEAYRVMGNYTGRILKSQRVMVLDEGFAWHASFGTRASGAGATTRLVFSD